MKDRRGLFLGTAVGRRTVALFVVCALVPSTVLAVLAYSKVRDTLLERSREELAQAAKAGAVTIIERAGWLARSSVLAAVAGASADSTYPHSTDFTAVWRSPHAAGGDWILESGGSPVTPRPPTVTAGAAAVQRLLARQPAIVIETGEQARVWVVLASGQGSLWAAPDQRVLWGFSPEERVLPHVCIVVAGLHTVLACSNDAPHAALVASMAGGSQSADVGGTLLSRRSVYLKREYAAPDLAVVTATTMTEALAPVNGFGRTFAMIACASLLAVFFFSHVQIRRTTEPLGKLTEATRLVAEGKLDTRLDITSKDEFGRLASSFTAMTSALQRQFALHEALDSLDDSALHGVELPEMVSVGADRVIWSTGASCALIALPTGSAGPGGEHWLTITRLVGKRTLMSGTTDKAPLLSGSTRAYTGNEARADAGLLGSADANLGEWLSLPLWDAGKPAGVICLQSADPWDLGGRRVEEARWFADRLALGAANLRMVSSLESLSVGTVTAFARAIDANSRWTAGHSERVTEVALIIGESLGLAESDSRNLRYGGLLHDIGKIGVPPAILDKAGALSEAERSVVESHPVLGVRILEPIPAFRQMLPVVRHHHERYDGKGYPDRLAGESIPYLARVLAVADVYDALVSDRPYRAGMDPVVAASHISTGAGSQFDPHIARLFLALHAERLFESTYQADRELESLARAVGAGRLLVGEPA